jgi:hypothetical protein
MKTPGMSEIVNRLEENPSGNTNVCDFVTCNSTATKVVKLPLGDRKVCILHLCDGCAPNFGYHSSITTNASDKMALVVAPNSAAKANKSSFHGGTAYDDR